MHKPLTTTEFINKAVKIHGNKYNYSLVEYLNNHTKISIKCLKCNTIFNQTPNNHLTGYGCGKCGGTKLKTNEEFIQDAIKIHADRFNYSYVKYISDRIPVKIKCIECNTIFNQTPNNHLRGDGCPKCKSSKGELKIMQFLKYNKISYIHQFKFKNCKGISNWPLKFDFFIPSKNLLIEFDGEQHFNSKYYKYKNIPIKKFKTLKINDKLKSNYARKNNIKLLRIPYWKLKNINEILTYKLV